MLLMVTPSLSAGAALTVILAGATAALGRLTWCFALTAAMPLLQLPVGAVTLAASDAPIGKPLAVKLKLPQVDNPNLAKPPV